MANFIERDIFDRVAKHLENKEISLIIGPRQVGKTVLTKQLRKYLLQKKKIDSSLIYYFNLDIYSDKDIFSEQADFITFIKERSRKDKIYIFIDEAQKIKDAGVFFKGVYDSDLNVKIILTGSSTLEIRSKIYESLTGRKRIFHLLPFSFFEIVKSKNKVLYDLLESNVKLLKHDQETLIGIYKEYCLWGGYPQVVLADSVFEKKEYLQEIFTSYIEKDVIGFLRIKNESNFIKLIKVLASQIGGLVDVAELSNDVNTDRYTIDRYLKALEKTFIIKKVHPFFVNRKKEIIKAPMLYFVDNGIRNLSLGLLDKTFDSLEKKGEVFENSVFKELFLMECEKIFNLKFWRTKQGSEVDFIIEQGQKFIPLEVKVDLKKDNISKSLSAYVKKYQPKKAFVVSLGYQGEREVLDTKIKFINPFNLKYYL